MIIGVIKETSPAAYLQQDEENQNANNISKNMAEWPIKLNDINGNVEISVPLDDCGLDVRNASVNQSYIDELDLGEIVKIQRETTVLETHKSFGSEALDPCDLINASLAGYMEDPSSNMKHILNGVDSVDTGEDMQLNASTNKASCASKDEENNELWSDFAGYCKTSLVQQQFFGTFHELSLREEDDSADKSSQQQSSQIPNGSFKNHHFPVQHHKSTNHKCDSEFKTSVSITNACAPKFTLKLNVFEKAEEELFSGNNPSQSAVFADNSLADSALKWTTFESNDQLANGTLQTVDCSDTEFSDFGTNAALCPTSSPSSQNQEIVSASSAVKAVTWNLLENIFQNSFPSEPMRHSFEDIPTLEKLLEINGKESDANGAKTLTSPEFASAWEVLQDLNKVSSRSCWNVSDSREKLLSTLGIDQNQKDVGQAGLQFPEDTMDCCSGLEKIGALPEVTKNGTKALIQTRISVSTSQRTVRSFTHRLETVFVHLLQMNGNRVREAPRIKRNSLFL
ncbi:uncharacterized protein [Heterodontus francisci]|uniref:uncharacterized protein n=1 Tax=Heterodontus francisci TaxID=7792 RepID=UPI00355C072D